MNFALLYGLFRQYIIEFIRVTMYLFSDSCDWNIVKNEYFLFSIL